jgi:hypothetical protein
MKTAELKGAALDWAVAKAEGHSFTAGDGGWYSDERINHRVWTLLPEIADNYECECYSPSTNWALGGVIIEREKIALHFNGDSPWVGECGWARRDGATPLEAAMRSYVAVKLGDDVEIPEELLK